MPFEHRTKSLGHGVVITPAVTVVQLTKVACLYELASFRSYTLRFWYDLSRMRSKEDREYYREEISRCILVEPATVATAVLDQRGTLVISFLLVEP